jgi:hypothetical protein
MNTFFNYIANQVGSFEPKDGCLIVTVILILLLLISVIFGSHSLSNEKSKYAKYVWFSIGSATLLLGSIVVLVSVFVTPKYTTNFKITGKWKTVYTNESKQVITSNITRPGPRFSSPTRIMVLPSLVSTPSDDSDTEPLNVTTADIPDMFPTETVTYFNNGKYKDVTYFDTKIQKDYDSEDARLYEDEAFTQITKIEENDLKITAKSNNLTHSKTVKTAIIHVRYSLLPETKKKLEEHKNKADAREELRKIVEDDSYWN